MPTENLMYSVLEGQDLPEENGYLLNSVIPQQPSQISMNDISENIELWLEEWNSAMTSGEWFEKASKRIRGHALLNANPHTNRPSYSKTYPCDRPQSVWLDQVIERELYFPERIGIHSSPSGLIDSPDNNNQTPDSLVPWPSQMAFRVSD